MPATAQRIDMTGRTVEWYDAAWTGVLVATEGTEIDEFNVEAKAALVFLGDSAAVIHGEPERLLEMLDQAREALRDVTVRAKGEAGLTTNLVRITKRRARHRWDTGLLVGVSNDDGGNGHQGFAMNPAYYAGCWPTFDDMVQASVDTRRPSRVFFWAPAVSPLG